MRSRLDPFEDDLVSDEGCASWTKRVAMQDMGEHPKVHQQDLGREVGGICKIGELVGIHVVGYGVEWYELEAC